VITNKNPIVLKIAACYHADQNFWKQLWEVLPTDTELADVHTDHSPPNYVDRIFQFKFMSDRFPPIPAWVSVPEMIPVMSAVPGRPSKLTGMMVDGVEPLWFKERLMERDKAEKPEPIRMPAATYLEALKGLQMQKGASGNCICDMEYTGLKTHRKDCPCHP
jgi:hypothetical protein